LLFGKYRSFLDHRVSTAGSLGFLELSSLRQGSAIL
jgi:hypothetical protein